MRQTGMNWIMPTSSAEVGFKTNLIIWILRATKYLSAAITKLLYTKEGIFFSARLIYQVFSFKAKNVDREEKKEWLEWAYIIAMFLSLSLLIFPSLSSPLIFFSSDCIEPQRTTFIL